jgi:hypothetical protein
LREEGIDGVIRGDHVFGRGAVHSDTDARVVSHLTLLDDYFGERERADLELPQQQIPTELERAEGESLATWRDRLSQQFAVPVLLAALSDLKCAYVEVANPLLAARVVRHVRTLTDGERTDKSLWRQAVGEALPDMPFAKRVSIVPLERFLTTPAMLELMADELGSARSRDCLGAGIINLTRSALTARLARTDRPRTGGRSRGVAVVARVISAARRRLGLERPAVSAVVLAFRACLIVRMGDLLAADAVALRAFTGKSNARGAESLPASLSL